MISEQLITKADIPSVAKRLAPFGVSEQEFTSHIESPGTVTTLVSSDDTPTLLARGRKSLRLDVSLNLGIDHDLTSQALIEAISRISVRARENGFAELIVDCPFPELANIATEQFGFTANGSALIKALI